MALTGQLSIADLLRQIPEPMPSTAPELAATLKRDLKPLKLDQLRGLEPFRSQVWIENRDFGKGGFLELFPADVSLYGRSIETGRDHFHFSYTFTDGRRHDHCRVDEFYGREWRVWPDRPTEEEREAVPWQIK